MPVPHEGGVAYQMLLASPPTNPLDREGSSPPEDPRVKKAAELPLALPSASLEYCPLDSVEGPFQEEEEAPTSPSG